MLFVEDGNESFSNSNQSRLQRFLNIARASICVQRFCILCKRLRSTSALGRHNVLLGGHNEPEPRIRPRPSHSPSSVNNRVWKAITWSMRLLGTVVFTSYEKTGSLLA